MNKPATMAPLGERLVDAGLITAEQLQEALKAQASMGEQIGKVLIALGYLQEDDLLRVLCKDAGIPFISLDQTVPDANLRDRIPESLARGHGALPLREDNGRLAVAMANPFDMRAVTAVERALGRPIRVVGAPRRQILQRLEEAFGGDGASAAAAPAPPAAAAPPFQQPVAAPRPAQRPPPGRRQAAAPVEEGGQAARIVDDILETGVALGSTDIHIEPLEEIVRVRYRVDGLLQDGQTYPKDLQASLLTRIKIVSGLNIAESRLPQDGRSRIAGAENDIDLRISTFPTVHGEDVVLRVLDRSRVELDLDRLGMVAEDQALLREVVHRPYGLVLVTGPTGSGKTTTLYSALAELNTRDRCIMTLEDPVEYELAGIRQSQINVRAGLTFASGLRSILRHDPDVILVGEMRDQETVQIALSSALTGHMVLSTLHTNSAAGAIPRLLDMGAEPFVLASSVRLVVAQRLVRALCPSCKQPVETTPEMRQRYDLGDAVLYKAAGCAACRQSGFRGRVGLYEMIPMTEEIAKFVYHERSAEEIQKHSKRPTLLQDGMRKVKAGLTSLDETLRVISV